MEPTKNIFTAFNSTSWDDGLKWVRLNKQIGIPLTVVDIGLNKENINKLNDLNVNVLPLEKKFGIEQTDIFNTMTSKMRNGIYMFWDILVQPEEIQQFWQVNKLITVKSLPVSISSLVYPFASIDLRVKFGEKIEQEVVAKFDGTLFSGLISGTPEVWGVFVGFYNHLIDSGTLESNLFGRNLALNLMAIYFPELIEVKSIPYQI